MTNDSLTFNFGTFQEATALEAVQDVIFINDLTEGEFDKLVDELKKKRDTKDPEALAAFISMKKEGKETFLKKAAAGRKKAEAQKTTEGVLSDEERKKKEPNKTDEETVYEAKESREWAEKVASYVTTKFGKNWGRLTESEKSDRWKAGIMEYALNHKSQNPDLDEAANWFQENGFRHGVSILRMT